MAAAGSGEATFSCGTIVPQMLEHFPCSPSCVGEAVRRKKGRITPIFHETRLDVGSRCVHPTPPFFFPNAYRQRECSRFQMPGLPAEGRKHIGRTLPMCRFHIPALPAATGDRAGTELILLHQLKPILSKCKFHAN